MSESLNTTLNKNSITIRNNTSHSWKQSIGFTGSLAIVIGSILGVGIFLTPPIVAKYVPSLSWFFAIWIFGGLMAMAGALTYSELGARFPKAGGDYVFLKAAYGKPIAFLSGWLALTATFSGSIAATSTGLTQYYLAPNLGSWFTDSIFSLGFISISPMKLTTIFIITTFSFANVRGLKFSGSIQTLISFTPFVLLAVLALFSILGQAHSTAATSIISVSSSDSTISSSPSSMTLSALGFALLPVFFAYSGWNASAYMGSEIKDAHKNLPRSIVIGIGAIIFLYILLNFLFVQGRDINSLRNLPNVIDSTAQSTLGNIGIPIFTLIISLAILASLNSTIMIGPRIYYEMAKDGLLFKRFATLSHTNSSPYQGLIFQAVLASIFVILGGFESILAYTTVIIVILSAITVFGLFIIRHKQNPNSKPAFKVPLYPIIPLFYIMTSVFIVGIIAITNPFQILVAILTMFVGYLVYCLFEKYKTKNQNLAEQK